MNILNEENGYLVFPSFLISEIDGENKNYLVVALRVKG